MDPEGGSNNVTPYVPVAVPADPARDARVAARRAADARRAGRALDRLLSGTVPPVLREEAAAAFVEEVGDYVLSQLQHNRSYARSGPAVVGYNGNDSVTGVPLCEHNDDVNACQRTNMRAGRPEGLRDVTSMHDTCIEVTSHAELAAGTRSWICGQDCPRQATP